MTETLIDTLKRENAELREQIAHLKKCLTGTDTAFIGLGLTTSETRVFAALMEREALTKDQILSITYADRLDVDLPDPKIVDVYICKIRKKLKPYGVEIETLWGRGYRITPEMKNRARYLKDRLSAHAPRAA